MLPVATAALGVVFLRERPAIGSVAGLTLATAGVVLVALTGARLGAGAALVLAGVLAYALYTVLLRRLNSPHGGGPTRGRGGRTDPIVLAAGTAVWGVLFLLPWQFAEIAGGRAELPANPTALVETLYLGLAGSGVTLLLWTYGAARTPATVSGVLTAAIPALGYAAAVATGESPSWVKTLGGVLAVAGVLLTAISTRTGAVPGDLANPPTSSPATGRVNVQ